MYPRAVLLSQKKQMKEILEVVVELLHSSTNQKQGRDAKDTLQRGFQYFQLAEGSLC